MISVEVVSVEIAALVTVTPKLAEWPQHILGATSEVPVQKTTVLGTVKILYRTLKFPGL